MQGNVMKMGNKEKVMRLEDWLNEKRNKAKTQNALETWHDILGQKTGGDREAG
jgi:hypothetical protein